jgi:hypothetical protein
VDIRISKNDLTREIKEDIFKHQKPLKSNITGIAKMAAKKQLKKRKSLVIS